MSDIIYKTKSFKVEHSCFTDDETKVQKVK